MPNRYDVRYRCRACGHLFNSGTITSENTPLQLLQEIYPRSVEIRAWVFHDCHQIIGSSGLPIRDDGIALQAGIADFAGLMKHSS